MQVGKNIGKKCKDKIYSTASPKISGFSASGGSELKVEFVSDKKIDVLKLQAKGKDGTTTTLTYGNVKASPLFSRVDQEKENGNLILKGEENGYAYEIFFLSNISGEAVVILEAAIGEDGKNGAVRQSEVVELEDNDAGAFL